MEKKLVVLCRCPTLLSNIVQTPQRLLSTSQYLLANTFNNKRQAKIMSKLLGNRVSGSKKRWFPNETTAADTPFLSSPEFSVRQKTPSKITQRRVTVLNKLFMTHITDLMATGEISENVVGKGLHISGVKVSLDFAFINVYWTLSNDDINRDEMEKELKRCSGILRHELSQLKVIGEVPRISFVRDRLNDNSRSVECILRTMEFEETQEPPDVADQVREDLNLKIPSNAGEKDGEEEENEFTEMRHDVLGLDHRAIMIRILTKMKKSKQAWESLNQGLEPNNIDSFPSTRDTLEQIQQKIQKANENSAEFEKFLARKRERKNTPERKRFNKFDQLLDNGEETFDHLEDYCNDEDYIDEDQFEKNSPDHRE